MSGLHGPRCGSCGQMWVGGSTVTCEHCGASLIEDAKTPEARSRASFPPWWRSWWAALVVGAVVVVGVVGLVLSIVASSDEAPDVTAPVADPADPEAPGDDDAAAPPQDAFDEVPDPGMTHCTVDDCELWRFELPGEGLLHIQDGMLIHTIWDVEPFSPQAAGGEEEEPQDLPDVVERTITVVELSTGELRWQQEVEMARVEHGHASPQLAGDLLLVPVPDGVVAYDIEDGSPGWTSDVVGLLSHARPYEGDAVVSVELPPAADGQGEEPDRAGRDRQALVRLDGRSGEVMWRRDGVSFAAWGEGHALLEDLEGAAIVAVDVRDGTESWRQEVTDGAVIRDGSLRVDVADDRVVLGESRRATVLDLDTGDLVVEMDEGIPLRARPWLLGSLLVFDRWDRAQFGGGFASPVPVQIVDLEDQGREVFRTDHAVDSAQVFEDGATDGADPGRPTGVAFLSHVDGAYYLTFVDSDGVIRWEEGWEEPTCCWTIAHDRADGTLAVIPHDLGEYPVRVLDVEDGSTVQTFDLPVDSARDDHARWGGSLVMLQRHTGQVVRTVVVGPEGWFAVATDAGGARLQSLSPVPIVQEGLELIAIDRDALVSGGS
jgi:hypothetical protein